MYRCDSQRFSAYVTCTSAILNHSERMWFVQVRFSVILSVYDLYKWLCTGYVTCTGNSALVHEGVCTIGLSPCSSQTSRVIASKSTVFRLKMPSVPRNDHFVFKYPSRGDSDFSPHQRPGDADF